MSILPLFSALVTKVLNSAGLSDKETFDVVKGLDTIEPINGRKKASQYQKAEYVFENITKLL